MLPDLRSGGGFTFVCWLDLKDSKNKAQSIIINGMSKVSGSLDEEDAEDITKGTVYIILGFHQVWYQGGVKARVSGVVENLKFKISEGSDQNWCFPDSAQLAVSV